MKDIKLFYGLLILSILFISTKSVTIHYIAEGGTNSTACVVFLESEEIEDDFVYLGYDFVFHGEFAPHSKDYASFEIDGNIASIKYAFTEKYNPYKIEDVNDIKEWKDIGYASNMNSVSISRTDNKMKTLLFKVFIKEKSGEIFAVNWASTGGDDINESINESDQSTQSDLTDKIEQSDKTETPVITDKIEQSDKPKPTVITDKVEQSDKPKPPEPLKTDKIDQSDSTNSDSNPEKSLIDKIKDIIKNIIDLIKRLFGLI